MIYIGADHRGFELKKSLMEKLKADGRELIDCGPSALDPQDDYPLIAQAVAEKVAGDPDSRGILICGSGEGVCIAANKVKGIRAALGLKPEIIKAARADDDINVLCLPADFEEELDIDSVLEVFLNTRFQGGERQQRRLKQISEYEDNPSH